MHHLACSTTWPALSRMGFMVQAFISSVSMRDGHRVLGHQFHRFVAKGGDNDKVDCTADDYCEFVYLSVSRVTDAPWLFPHGASFECYHALAEKDRRWVCIKNHKLDVVY